MRIRRLLRRTSSFDQPSAVWWYKSYTTHPSGPFSKLRISAAPQHASASPLTCGDFRLLLPLDRRKNHRHPAPLHRGMSLHLDRLAELADDLAEGRHGALAVSALAAAKQHGKLDFVPDFQKRFGAVHFDETVVRVSLGAKADFLQLYDMSTGRAFVALFLLVLVFAVVHYAAYRRPFHWGNLNQVKPRLFRHTQRFVDRDDTDLALFLIDQPYRCYTDPLIETWCFCDGLLPFKRITNY